MFFDGISLNMFKWIPIKFTTPLPKPLGRWCLCGDKKNVNVTDVLEKKVRQKQQRSFLIEHNIDPYHLYKKKKSKTEEDAYLPFYVFDV